MSSLRVLLVEDDATFCLVLKDHLSVRGVEVRTTARVVEARKLALSSLFDVVVLDQNLPDGDGVMLAQELLAAGLQTKIILATAHADVTRAIAATRAGVYDYLQKPLELTTLEETIRRAARAARAQTVLSPQVAGHGRVEAPRLVGSSPATVRLRAQLEAAARACPAPVLITGETGSGKGVAARWVHCTGPRSQGPLVVVNCAAIPETMFEAELFGHERGAFTGAVQARVGLFEAAHGGTLVLDEIGELSLPMQSKLLRALEEGVVRRVGAHAERVVDVCAIATTNRRVESMVDAGEFRRDLYYRIAVVRIDLPPLRERREDIPLLVRSFLEELGSEQPGAMSDEEIEFLQRHDWPGNVRELRNVLQRWQISRHTGPDLEPVGLVHPANSAVAVQVESDVHPVSSPSMDSFTARGFEGASVLPHSFPTLAEVEARHIHEALSCCRNNRSQAARLLGISRGTLRRKLQNVTSND